MDRRGGRPGGADVVVFVLLAGAAVAVGIATGPAIVDRVAELLAAGADDAPSPAASATSPAPIRVTFDDAGRPYDVALPEGFEVVREELATLQLPSGWIAIVPGEALPWLQPDDPALERVRLGDPGEYRVEVVWLQRTGAPDTRRPAGLILRASDRPVHRWGEFEHSYGTDAGIGAVTTPEYPRSNGDKTAEELETGEANGLLDRFIDAGESILIEDLDGAPGPDTILFDNGFGDGGYPKSHGVDADDRLAAVAIWHLIAPWRLAIPEGTPPADVARREREMAECLDGRREVTSSGHCVSGTGRPT